MQLDCSCGRFLCSPCTLTVGSAARRHRQSISTAELRGRTDVLSGRNGVGSPGESSRASRWHEPDTPDVATDE
eukprot:1205661-Prymnesium_polylepis.1